MVPCCIKQSSILTQVEYVSVYTAKNATGLLQFVNFTGFSQIVEKLQQDCQCHQVATSLSKSGLLQLVTWRLVTAC